MGLGADDGTEARDPVRGRRRDGAADELGGRAPDELYVNPAGVRVELTERARVASATVEES